jgi:hypothetical protein
MSALLASVDTVILQDQNRALNNAQRRK